MTAKKTNVCPECGGEMIWEKRPTTVEYQGARATVKVPGWWCTSCDEGILEGKALLMRERAFKTLKARVDGVLGPAEVARARRAIGYSQRKAGKVLGGGLRAFQKYESGQAAVSMAMSHLLRLLEDNPSLAGKLEGFTGPKRHARRASAMKRSKPKARRSQ